jgi:hypothetical protein
MHTVKNRVRIFVLVIPLAFVGCGGGTSDTSNATGTATPTPGVTSSSPKFAPLVDASCSTYGTNKFLTNQPDNAAIVVNKCTLPIQVNGCWVPKDAPNCNAQPDSKWFATATMTAGKAAFVPKPDSTEDAVLAYVVCDMTDPSATCSRNGNAGFSKAQIVKLDGFQLEIYGPNAVTAPATPVSRPPAEAVVPIGSFTVTSTATPPPVPVPPSGPAPVVDFTTSDTLNQSGIYNEWDISVKNTGNVRELCTVAATYRYLDNSNSGVNIINTLVTDSRNQTLLLPAGQTGMAKFGFTDRTIQTVPPYTVSCKQY